MTINEFFSTFGVNSRTTSDFVQSAVTTSNNVQLSFNVYLFAFTVFFLFYLLKNIIPIKFEIHLSVALRYVSRACKRHFKQRILTQDLNDAVAAAVTYDSTVFPYPMHLRLIHDSSKQTAFLHRNKVYVLLKHSENEAINYVHAMAMYVEAGFIPNGKTLLNPRLARAYNLAMVRRIIETADNQCRKYFLDRFFSEYLQNDQKVFDLYCKLLKADERGVFIPILASQAEKIANTIEYSETNIQLIADFHEFIDCLLRIVSSENIRTINTSIFKRYLRVSVFSFYNFNNVCCPQQILHQLLAYRNEGYSYIYLLSIENNPSTIKEVLSLLPLLKKEFSLINIKKNHFMQIDGYKKQTICIEFRK